MSPDCQSSTALQNVKTKYHRGKPPRTVYFKIFIEDAKSNYVMKVGKWLKPRYKLRTTNKSYSRLHFVRISIDIKQKIHLKKVVAIFDTRTNSNLINGHGRFWWEILFNTTQWTELSSITHPNWFNILIPLHFREKGETKNT